MERLKAVVDTNVYVSLLLSQRGAGAWLMAIWREQKYAIIISDTLYTELLEVLKRPCIAPKIDVHRKNALLRRLHRDAIWTPGTFDAQGVLPDPDDDMLISAAIETESEFIITWDKALHGDYRGIHIVSPDVFIAMVI